nr:hypothetical protein FVER53263_10511 [Fusarium verticillioides]
MPLIKDQLSFKISLLPGDAHGSQLASCAEQIMHLIEDIRPDVAFQISRHDFGGVALAAGHQSSLPTSTLEACRQSDVAVVCVCGDPKYCIQLEQGLLALRQELGLFANIRPVKFPSESLIPLSSYKPEAVDGLDITFSRDLTGGAYYGEKQEVGEDGEAYDTTSYSRSTIETGKTGWHVNVMATSRLWRSVVTDIFSHEHPQVQLDHVFVDNAAMILSSNPQNLNGVILTENMFGDILSDQASGNSSLQTFWHQRLCPASMVKPYPKLSDKLLILSARLDRTRGRPTWVAQHHHKSSFMETLLHNFDYYLEALNSADAAAIPAPIPPPSSPRDTTNTRPMGVIEKILTHAGIGLSKSYVEMGDMICVKVDWTLTSELLWGGMEKTYN